MRLVGALGLGAPMAGLLLAELFALGSLGLAQAGLDLLPTLGRAVQTSSLIVVGLLAVMGLQQAETGRWDGFLLVEASTGPGCTTRPTPSRRTPSVKLPHPAPTRSSRWPARSPPRDQFRLVTVVALVDVGAILTAGERTPLDLAVLAAV